MYRRLGYFPTESSEHSAEYSPWYMRHDSEIERLRIPVADYVGRSAAGVDEYEAVKARLAAGEPFAVERSWEYASVIINSMETGEPSVIYGNVRNTGLITNLPDGICVEVPCLVDRTGVNPTHVGDVAPQCAALNRTFSNVCDLTVRAVLEGRRDHITHAAMMDPNTAPPASRSTRSTRSSPSCSTPTATCCRSRCAGGWGGGALLGWRGVAGRSCTAAERVSAAIDAAEHEGPAVIVGIDGPGGAGKSTLARELALLRDDVAIVAGDDFYRPLPERTREALTPLEAVDLRSTGSACATRCWRRSCAARTRATAATTGSPGDSARSGPRCPRPASWWSRASTSRARRCAATST